MRQSPAQRLAREPEESHGQRRPLTRRLLPCPRSPSPSLLRRHSSVSSACSCSVLVPAAWSSTDRLPTWLCLRPPTARRFKPEMSHGANNGLPVALTLLTPVKEAHPTLGWADLIQLGSAVAVEVRCLSIYFTIHLLSAAKLQARVWAGRASSSCWARRGSGGGCAQGAWPASRWRWWDTEPHAAVLLGGERGQGAGTAAPPSPDGAPPPCLTTAPLLPAACRWPLPPYGDCNGTVLLPLPHPCRPPAVPSSPSAWAARTPRARSTAPPTAACPPPPRRSPTPRPARRRCSHAALRGGGN